MKRNEIPQPPAKLMVGPGGWVQVVDLDGYVAALVRFRRRDDGRLRPNALLLDAYDQPDLNVQKMRAFPLAVVETMANTPEYRAEIVESLDLETEIRVWSGDSPIELHSVTRRTRRTSLQLRKLPQVYGRGRYPDRFYVEVAALYRFLVEREGDRAPAQTIADANNIPVTTVHRWIREARRRQLLAPASDQGVTG